MPLTSRQRRDLALVIATATLVGMTFSLAVPLLSLVLERHGTAPFWIGVNTAAGGCGIFLVAPFIGRLVGRFGPVRCIQGALVFTAACMLVFPLWIDERFWFALRLLLGCAGSLLFVLSEAAVNALAPEHLRGRVIGVYATLFCVGFASGPLVLVVAGSEGTLPFLLAAALFLLGLIPATLLHSVGDRLMPEGSGRGHKLRHTWGVAPTAMAAVFAYALLEAAYFALSPVYALDTGTTERGAAALVSVWLSGNILLQYPLGWLADRWRRERVMALCAAAATLGQLLVPLAVGTPALWPLLVLLGGTMGGLYTLSLALVGERFRGADLTQANTAFVMTFQLGTIVGPPYTGAVMGGAGAASFPLALAVPPLLLLAVLLVAGGRFNRARACRS